MSTRLILGVTGLFLLAGPTAASQVYQQALAALDVNAREFVQAQDYVIVDPDSLTGDHYYSK